MMSGFLFPSTHYTEQLDPDSVQGEVETESYVSGSVFKVNKTSLTCRIRSRLETSGRTHSFKALSVSVSFAR